MNDENSEFWENMNSSLNDLDIKNNEILKACTNPQAIIKINNLEKSCEEKKSYSLTKAILLECSHSLDEKCQKIIRDAVKKLIYTRGPYQIFCPCEDCSHVLTDSELYAILQSKSFMQFISNCEIKDENENPQICYFCSSTNDSNILYLRIHKNHTICKKCLARYAKGKNNDVPMKCPFRGCEFHFNAQNIDNHSFGENNILKPMPGGKIINCEFCPGDSTTKEVYYCYSGCEHGACLNEIKVYINKNIENGYSLSSFNCVKCETQHEIRRIKRQILALIFTEEEVKKLELEQYKKDNKIDLCTECYKDISWKGIKGKRDITCEHCGKVMCKICREAMHAGKCKIRKDRIKDVLSIDPNMAICPYCLQIILKNVEERTCDTLTCKDCHRTYCAKCYAKLDPALAHGIAYHRSQCRIGKNEEPAIMKPECPECQRLGKLCPRPKDLEENDIPYDEWPEL